MVAVCVSKPCADSMSPHYLSNTHCPHTGYQQSRGILAQLHQYIHESQMLLLGCKTSPAWYHAEESSKLLPHVPQRHLIVQGSNMLSASVASKKEERGCFTVGHSGQVSKDIKLQ